MSIPKLYNTWMNKIMQLLPTERITRVQNLAWMIAGILSKQIGSFEQSSQ